MKKVFLGFIVLFMLFSCSFGTETKEEKLAKEKEKQEKILQEKLKQQELERLAKFDSRFKREKEKSLSGYLCFAETLEHPGTGLSLKTKNCKEEYGSGFTYFKIKGNSIYKLDEKSETRIIKIISKKETDPIQIAISTNIISNFENILDLKNCKSVRVNKKNFFVDDENKEIYIIEPTGYYKNESDKQIKNSPQTSVCNGFYPNENKIILSDIKHKTFFLEIMKNDLIDIDSIKILNN